MKDSIFWGVIGVGVVVGLFTIGYGLCKNSQPSPSFSSVAYADDATPQKTELVFKNLGRGSHGELAFERAKVTGGWILMVRRINSDVVDGFTFYPDPKREWDGGSLE